MYKLIKIGNQANVQAREYFVDSESDIPNLPADDPFGSMLLVINTGEVKVKNSAGAWVTYN